VLVKDTTYSFVFVKVWNLQLPNGGCNAGRTQKMLMLPWIP